MNSNCQYLGWKDPFLDSAVDWIMENRQDSLDNLTIALPGKRALRGLEERIALATQACDGVPRLVSIGQLSDLLVETDIPRANDMTRLLAWVEALQSLDTKALQLLIAAPPASGDLPAWLNLAQILRTLHANIAAEMLDFGDVLKSGSLPSTEETLRWDLLQDLQIAYRSTLLSMGVSDPHDARAEKIREEQVSVEGEILLVGITDINKLQRSALELVQSQVTSLIFAPTEKSNMFDSLGCVHVDAWTDPELRIPIEEEDWSVANLPQDQSQLTVQALAKWNGEFSADEISIAVLDDEVRPYLERSFHSQGIATHHAEGTSIRQSSPWRLLDALASWLDGRLERNLAPLVRHSELCSAFSFPKTISELDAYHNKHLPHTFGSKILGKPERSRDLKAFIAKVDESLNLDSEQGSEARPVEDWIPCIQSFLETVWGEYELNEDIPRDFQTVSAIRVLSNGMESFLDTPQRLRKLLSLSLPATLRLLLQQVGGEFTSEKNPSSFVEMVGWLETRMDPAKAIVVCGFNEGKVPESKHADIFLPDLLLGNLGMPGNRDRYARDAYALTALFGGNRKIHLICGRQSTEGDRHRPSRLLFHCEPAQISKRLGRFLEVDGAPGGAFGKSIQEDFEPPRRDALPELTSMRVTDFAAYLHSP
ncbi:MAG: hypothetical protein QF524_08365, partial [Planctomycetota bacterium]|nr:hypothetical protein [Planctomycetota bacterium]